MNNAAPWVDEEGTFHEVCSASFYIGHSELGSSQFDPGSHPSLRYRRSGTAYFCSDCGEIWARIVVLGHRAELLDFRVEQVKCDTHGEGSLLEGLEGLLEILPPAAVQREFELHLRKAIEWSQQQQQ